KVDQLYGLVRLPARENDNGVDQTRISPADAAILNRLKRLRYNPLDYAELSAERKKQIQNVLVYLKCELGEIYKKLRIGGRLIQSRPDANASDAHKRFAAAIEGIKLSPEDIEFLLGLPPRSETRDSQAQPAVTTEREFSHHDDNELTKRA